ncbi:MAG: SEC-C metal-binding domain-containing protein [Paludibaculum sp.]
MTYEAKLERQYDRAHQGLLKTHEKLSRCGARQTPSQIDAIAPAPVRTDKPNPRPALQPEPNHEAVEASAVSTPRNAPCPCGSGEKYKRCCGRHAPAVLGPGHLAA